MIAVDLHAVEPAMTKLAIIGGSGLNDLEELEIVRQEVVHTPFGEPSRILPRGEGHISAASRRPPHHSAAPGELSGQYLGSETGRRGTNYRRSRSGWYHAIHGARLHRDSESTSRLDLRP